MLSCTHSRMLLFIQRSAVGKRALKMLSPTPAARLSCSPPTSARPLILFFFFAFLVVTVAHALPRSLSPSVSLQHIFLSQLSSLISFSFLTHTHTPPRPNSPHPSPPSHHLCSCIKVSQCSPASSKLTFPPFKKPPLAH